MFRNIVVLIEEVLILSKTRLFFFFMEFARTLAVYEKLCLMFNATFRELNDLINKEIYDRTAICVRSTCCVWRTRRKAWFYRSRRPAPASFPSETWPNGACAAHEVLRAFIVIRIEVNETREQIDGID